MIISLELIREHAHIDADELSAELLTQYYNAAVRSAETYIHRVLVSDTDTNAVAATEDNVPADVKQYLLLTVTDFVEKRERVTEKTLSTYFNHLLDQYVDYSY